MIPISSVRFGDEEERAVLAVLRSGHVAQGPRVAELESRFAELTGVAHGIAVNNGTTSLVASLQALGIGPGDEVITSPFTFVATLNAILEAGATAVFADIDPAAFTLDPASIEHAVTDRTRAIMPVHLYGLMADMVAIERIAEAHGLAIVEDAAQAHGAERDGRRAGATGVGSFSFYATKNVTSGEGGMITTDDDALADRLRLLRNQGMRARYEYVVAGHNYRLTDLQAALCLPQLDHYPEIVATRTAHAGGLSRLLAGSARIATPIVPDGATHVWHQYTVRIEGATSDERDGVVDRLAEHGVGAGVYYPRLVWDYEPYRDDPRVRIGEHPIAARVAREVVSLPVHQHLAPGDVDRIAEALVASVNPRAPV